MQSLAIDSWSSVQSSRKPARARLPLELPPRILRVAPRGFGVPRHAAGPTEEPEKLQEEPDHLPSSQHHVADFSLPPVVLSGTPRPSLSVQVVCAKGNAFNKALAIQKGV